MNTQRIRRMKWFWLSVLFASVAACTTTNGPITTPECIKQEIATAKAFLAGAAKKTRESFRAMSFEEFERNTYKEPFEGGKYIVNGDTPIPTKEALKKFFNGNVQEEPVIAPTGLAVNQVNGQDTVWDDTQKQNLTYCVSTTFGPRHAEMVSQMAAAGSAWEGAAALNLVHVATEDGNCTADNQNVVFDVRPVNVNGQYLARAFFPDEPRPARNVLIDESSFQLDPSGKLSLVGILRHELGHSLGFRHEHTRPESGQCFEDNNWSPLTDYDPFSVMHYPQCNGLGDWSLTLTALDKQGAACKYGATPGAPAPTNCDRGTTPEPDPPVCEARTHPFSFQQLAFTNLSKY